MVRLCRIIWDAITTDHIVFTANTLLAIPPPPTYPKLDFLPIIIRPGTLGAVLVFNICCLAGIAVTMYKAGSKGQYYSNYSNIDLIIRYGPGLIATCTTLIYRSITTTLARILPYILLADKIPKDGHEEGSITLGMPYMPVTALPFVIGRSRQILRLSTRLGMIVGGQITAYKSSFLSVTQVESGWVISVHRSIGWTLVAIYIVIILLELNITIKLWSCTTGLRWDPVSIADQMALFNQSNVLEDFDAVERDVDKLAYDILLGKKYRLGYWEKGIDGKIWYGIGKVCNGSKSHYALLRRYITY